MNQVRRRRSVCHAPLFGLSLLPLIAAGVARAAPPTLPSGGAVVVGQAVVGPPSSGALTITQSSGKAIINWHDFSIGQGGKVQIDNGSGATLNRVTGTQVSSLNGLLSATGSVYLLNPNGIIVGRTGVVDVGGTFVASTLNVTDQNFMAGGSLSFAGGSNGAVVNLGKIGALGGDVALIAEKVDNEASIAAPNGTVGLISGFNVVMRDAALNDGLFSVLVGGPDTTVTNGGAILAANAELRAELGNVYALAGNTAGVIRATGVKSGQGKVWLVANGGALDVFGSVSAQGSGGAAGAIETSGRSVTIGKASIDAHGGTWLVDPVDLTIDAAAAATISASLNGGTSVTEQTTSSASAGAGSVNTSGAGDIIVAAPISWSTGAGLTLSAYRNVAVDATLSSTGGGAVVLQADNAATGVGTVAFKGGSVVTSGATTILYNPINYASPTNFSTVVSGGGALTPYMLINQPTDLQKINTNLAGYYALNPSLNYNSMDMRSIANFTPIGSDKTPFTGIFNGSPLQVREGQIFGLSINQPTKDSVGLFGHVGKGAVIENLFLQVASITGHNAVGALAGINEGTISNVDTDGNVTGHDFVGGVVGKNYFSLNNVESGTTRFGFNSGSIVGVDYVGGIVGENSTYLGQSQSIAQTVDIFSLVSVTGSGMAIGGLLGGNDAGASLTTTTGAGAQSTSFASVSGGSNSTDVGGVVGLNAGAISGVIFDGTYGASVLNGGANTGGIVGVNATSGVVSGIQVLNAPVTGVAATGGVVGQNYGSIKKSEANNVVVKGANYVGGVAGQNFDLISGSYVDNGSSVSGVSYVGGIAGWNGRKSGSVAPSTAAIQSNSYTDATTTTTGTGRNVGGIVGYNDVGSLVSGSAGDGVVTGANLKGDAIGAVAGYNAGTISKSNGYARVVDASAASGQGIDYLGGLVGYNSSTGMVTGSSASGQSVTGNLSYVGGLVGYNEGAIAASTSSDAVSALAAGGVAGGLVAYNAVPATVESSSASGPVTVSAASKIGSVAGGVAGVNLGLISGSASTSQVSGSGDGTAGNSIGGIAGYNSKDAVVTNSNASGGVSGQGLDFVGGAVGRNYGVITGSSASGAASLTNARGGSVGGLVGKNYFGSFIGKTGAAASFATGSVSTDGVSSVGGLVGANAGTVFQAYASGSIINTGLGAANIGGLVGDNSGSISYAYALGAVNGGITRSDAMGGLIGANERGGSVSQAYATGKVTINAGPPPSSRPKTGGVVGANAGMIASSVYFDQATTSQSIADGINTGTDKSLAFDTGKTNSSPFSAASYSNLDFGSNGFVIFEGSTRPFLRSEASSMIINLHQLQLAALSPGQAYTLGADIDASSTNGANASDMWNVTGFGAIGTANSPFTGVFNGADRLSGVLHTISNLTINRPTTDAIGLFGTVGRNGMVINVTLANSSITGGNSTGAVAGVNYGLISNAVVEGRTFITGENAVGGVAGKNFGTVAYAVNSAVTKNATTVMGVDDVGGIVGWNATPVGSGTSTGAVVSDAISNATVAATGNDAGGVVGLNDAGGAITNPYYTGLLGTLAPTGAVSNLGGIAGYNAGVITGVKNADTVNGAKIFGTAQASNVGGVAGFNTGSISNVAVENTVIDSGVGAAGMVANYGGVVGYNAVGSTLTYALASAQVGVGGLANAAGGLVGLNLGAVDASQFGDLAFATRASSTSPVASSVAGHDLVGGAIGSNSGSVVGVSTSTAVSGRDAVGGLVGLNAGTGSLAATVADSFTDSNVSGAGDVGGLIGRNAALGTVSASWALGSAALNGVATNLETALGGLIGYNGGIVKTSYSGGSVASLKATPSSGLIGGLIGDNAGSVSDVYAFTSIAANAGPYRIGGLVGVNEKTASIANAYASGAVNAASASGAGEYVGGIAGANGGVLSGTYFDQTTTGVSQGVMYKGAGYAGSGAPIAIGVGAADAFAKATYAAFNFSTNWYMIAGATRPILRAEYSTTLTNAHQLQLMVLDPTATYFLANNIDAAGTGASSGDVWRSARTADSNGSWGFNPIGSDNAPFTGTLLGGGFKIANLNIVEPTTSSVGLFGRLAPSAFVADLGFENASIYGLNEVGVLAGKSAGAILDLTVDSSVVNGTSAVGGLLGRNFGSIYGAAIQNTNVTGTGQYVGGLVGFNGTFAAGANVAQASINTATFANGQVANSDAGSENDLGGLVGFNAANGLIISSQTYGASVIGAGSVVGGLAGRNDGQVLVSFSGMRLDNTVAGGVSYAGDLVSGLDKVGGFVGQNTGSLIGNSSARNTVNGLRYVGGLVGYNDKASNSLTPAVILGQYSTTIEAVNSDTITGISATNQEVDIGGLVGYNGVGGQVSQAYSNFSSVYGALVKGAGGSPNGGYAVGGLAGVNYGSIVDSGAGNQTTIGAQAVGGVVGSNAGTLTRVRANGGGYGSGGLGIIGDSYVGGIVGFNGGLSSSSPSGILDTAIYTQGSVFGYGIAGAGTEADVGGIVGKNAAGGVVTNVLASISGLVGVTSAGNNVGGLIGRNSGKSSYLIGEGVNVQGGDEVGGLVGLNDGSLANELLMFGSVTGDNYVGGAVGYNGGGVGTPSIDQAAVQIVEVKWSGAGAGRDFGGFAGYNSGIISNSYSGQSVVNFGLSLGYTSSVEDIAGMSNVGGFVGYNSGAVTTSYTMASLDLKGSHGADNTGAFAGLNMAVSGLNSDYFNLDKVGMAKAVGFGSAMGVKGLTDLQSRDSTNYIGFDFTKIWYGGEYPTLYVEDTLALLIPRN